MKQKPIKSAADAHDRISKAIGGATENGTAIGLTHNNAASLTGKKTGLVNAEAALDAAKTELATRLSSLTALTATAIAFITLARDMLKPRFGSGHSAAWDVVGFIGSLQLPRTVAQVKFKLQKLATFLTANPDEENAQKNITAARAQAILDDIVTRENSVTVQRAAVRNAVTSKSTAVKTVIKAISNLTGELKNLVLPLDPVYLTFGLNMPGAKETPSVPTNLIAVLVGPTSVAVKWDRSERAERYRIYKKVLGVDTEMVLVESREDLDFVLEGLPSGKTIQIAVSAVNNGGESQLSETVSVATP